MRKHKTIVVKPFCSSQEESLLKLPVPTNWLRLFQKTNSQNNPKIFQVNVTEIVFSIKKRILANAECLIIEYLRIKLTYTGIFILLREHFHKSFCSFLFSLFWDCSKNEYLSSALNMIHLKRTYTMTIILLKGSEIKFSESFNLCFLFLTSRSQSFWKWCLYWFPRTAKTKYHKLGCLNNRNLFSHSLGS